MLNILFWSTIECEEIAQQSIIAWVIWLQYELLKEREREAAISLIFLYFTQPTTEGDSLKNMNQSLYVTNSYTYRYSLDLVEAQVNWIRTIVKLCVARIKVRVFALLCFALELCLLCRVVVASHVYFSISYLSTYLQLQSYCQLPVRVHQHIVLSYCSTEQEILQVATTEALLNAIVFISTNALCTAVSQHGMELTPPSRRSLKLIICF